MYVQLRLVLDTDADAAWRALRSPTVMRALYAPFLEMGEIGSGTLWHDTTDRVPLRLAGTLPIGRQLVDLRYDESTHEGVRMLRDTGGAASGPLRALRGWNHRMAVSSAPGDPGKTLLRDRLTFHGAAAPAFWYPLWTIWQWRGSRLRDMARSWAYDPELQHSGEESDGDDAESHRGDAESPRDDAER